MTADPQRPIRDLVAIGCSAGGVEALPRILQQLPRDLPAAVLIVQHLADTGPRYLAGLLDRTSRMAVEWAEQGARIVHGHVYVAPPGVHLLVIDDHLQLTSSARENYARPSIDKLFRSVAAHHASRAIGVLLTGMMDDGVAGLRAIRDAGGTAIVQDPADAAFSELPRRALLVVNPERVLPIDAIGGALVSLVGQPVRPATPPREIMLEATFDQSDGVTPAQMDLLGPRIGVACPECHGPMWQIGDAEARRFRCYLGHVATARQIVSASTEQVESALWSAVRALNDRATTLETLDADARGIGNGQAAEAYRRRASEARQQAELARRFMIDLSSRGEPAESSSAGEPTDPRQSPAAGDLPEPSDPGGPASPGRDTSESEQSAR